MVNLGWSEMFYRLFRSRWLPGVDVIWRVAQNLGTTANPNWQRYQDLPFDGILLDILAGILILLVIDWAVKALRRYH